MDRRRIPLTRTDLLHIALAALIIGVVYWLYFGGETVRLEKGGKESVFKWLQLRWITGRRTYGIVYDLFAWLVPAVSLGLVWIRREALRSAEKRTWWPAWGLIVLCLLAHWVGSKTEHPRLSLLSFIALTGAIPLFLYGWAVARQLIFPCAYLLLWVPLNFLDGMVFRLRVVMAQITGLVLNGLGVECRIAGTRILAAEEGGFVLESQPAAAAFGTLLFCFGISAVLGNLSQKAGWKKWAVFLSVFPAFFVVSILTVVAFGLIAGTLGQNPLDWLNRHALTPLLNLLVVFLVISLATSMRTRWFLDLHRRAP
jgi:hypothetical protein